MLFKDTVPIHTNESINYDPTRGFLLSNLEVPYGQYKCVANGEPEKDYLLVHILPDDNRKKIILLKKP